MVLSRYVIFVLAPSLLAGLIACSQPTASESQAVAPSPSAPNNPNPSRSSAGYSGFRVSEHSEPKSSVSQHQAATTPEERIQVEAPSQSSQADAQKSSEFRCTGMVAYDPDDSSVNIRDRPNGQVIATVPNLTPIGTLRLHRSAWNRTYIPGSDGEPGYIWGGLVRFSRLQVQDPEDTMANIRTAPNGEVVAALANGTKVTFLGIEGDWTHVEMDNGYRGYITTSRLTNTGTLEC